MASAADGCGLLFQGVYFSRLWSAVSHALVLFLQAYLESQEGGQNHSREDKLQILNALINEVYVHKLQSYKLSSRINKEGEQGEERHLEYQIVT